jgi:hypothetical protein
MKKISDFYEAYNFLRHHPMCVLKKINYFNRCLDIDVVKVCPETNAIEDDPALNTKTQIWLEFGGMDEDEYFGVIPCHDIDLDCGGDTFEEAIIKLANLVLKKYGNYKGR